jgi:hypothetical protein
MRRGDRTQSLKQRGRNREYCKALRGEDSIPPIGKDAYEEIEVYKKGSESEDDTGDSFLRGYLIKITFGEIGVSDKNGGQDGGHKATHRFLEVYQEGQSDAYTNGYLGIREVIDRPIHDITYFLNDLHR